MTSSVVTQFTRNHGKLLLAVAMDPREVGRRIKLARERKGLTQLEFALEANVSPSSVARWESGKLPPVRELMRLADLLEVPVEDLVESPGESGATLTDLAVEVATVRGQLARVLELLEPGESPQSGQGSR